MKPSTLTTTATDKAITFVYQREPNETETDPRPASSSQGRKRRENDYSQQAAPASSP